jgi:hypothetical protein
MSLFQNASFEAPNRSLAEAASEALTTAFEEVGLQFSNLHPTIQAVMKRAAISSAHAKQQVERFVRVAAMADKYDLSDEQKQYALVKAYERHGERIGMGAKVVSLRRQPFPTRPVIMDRTSDSHI